MNISWENDLLDIAQWAMQSLDLRYRYLYSETANALSGTPGLPNCIETAIVFAIYEAAIGKSHSCGWDVKHEMSHPSDGYNPKRSDLAFKPYGQGRNWAHVEVKEYDASGKSNIAKDIDKLKLLTGVQRWILAYRIIPKDSRSIALAELLERNYDGSDGQKLVIHGSREFATLTENGYDGICDICLARIQYEARRGL